MIVLLSGGNWISGLEEDTTYLWFVNVTDSGSGEYTRRTFVFTTEQSCQEEEQDEENEEENEEDEELDICSVEIIKPFENLVYINNEEKCPFIMPLIIVFIDQHF